MTLYIRNGRYYYKKQIDKKPYYKALRLKRGQEELLSARISQVEKEIIAEHFNIPYSKSKFIDLESYIKIYVKQKRHKKSLNRDVQRLRYVHKIWTNLYLEQIGKSQIRKLEEQLFKDNKSTTTINRYFGLLRHFFNLAIEDEYLKENPARYYTPFVEDGTRRALSKDEIHKILKATKYIQENPNTRIQKYIHDITLIALYTGLRLSEILNLKKSYIQDNIILIPITKTKYKRRQVGQSQNVRVSYLSDGIKNIITKNKIKSDYLFDIKRDPNVIFWTIRRIRKLSGIGDFTFHLLRHTISTWVSSQADLITAKTILGHSDIKTTLRYSHPEIEKIKEGVAKIEDNLKDILRDI